MPLGLEIAQLAHHLRPIFGLVRKGLTIWFCKKRYSASDPLQCYPRLPQTPSGSNCAAQLGRCQGGGGTLPASLDLWNIHLHIFPQLDPPAMFGWASEKRSLFGIQGPEIKLHFLLGQLARQLVTWELAQCANMYWFLILISTWVPGCLNISPSFKSWILTSEKRTKLPEFGSWGGGVR